MSEEWQDPLEVFPPHSIEGQVLKAIRTVLTHPDTWEEVNDPEMPEEQRGRMTLERCVAHLRCHGILISNLSLHPHTRVELREQTDAVLEFVPAWAEATVYGVEKMSGRLYAVGQCQVLRVHRAALERIISEQILDPDSFLETLAAAPIPEAGDDEPGDEILAGANMAMTAHMKVIVDLAHSLDRFFEGKD
jgi:hypothetical protein